ncbi:MAG: hypothetical protein F4Z67_06590 [Synechococcus sp. SB0667_bin_8]|nr:hypothetical protein [Synechococcus sp. SB0667_bin_8]
MSGQLAWRSKQVRGTPPEPWETWDVDLPDGLTDPWNIRASEARLNKRINDFRVDFKAEIKDIKAEIRAVNHKLDRATGTTTGGNPADGQILRWAAVKGSFGG